MSRGPLLFAVEFPLLALSTLFVGLRFYCRHFTVRKVGLDDWIMLVALVNVWVIGVINVFQVKYGSGTHVMDLPFTPDLFVKSLKAWYVYQLEYLITLFFVKISILAFYRRLSPAQGFQTAIKVVAISVTIYTTAMVFVNALECPKDPTLAWALTFPRGCNNLVSVYYAQAGFNIFSDIVILVLPLPSLLRLQVNKRKRMALIVVFGIGSVAVIASIARISALYIFQYSTDIAYDGIFILLWSQVEINVAIISASAPGIRPLVKPITGGSTTGMSGGYTYPVSHGNQSRRLALQSFAGTSRGGGATSKVVGGRGTMNESEDNIVTKSGIMRTTDVRVEILPDGRSESLKDLEYGHGR
ncbi:hypothetical protein L873DRAFT_1839613 [Choiromyces venosus 120613-1]|uniref:Rhodopsin domain-containing protein n=1 Tax=Choiromyces venosus 120613-1 TaxID=1336337 RepID=A0A3N4K9Y2_9PEZI|nr:hypothetical protein L873DRAFT_1839613 [Choiromyces venosus 120613-1]